jgi:hypothetical protein
MATVVSPLNCGRERLMYANGIDTACDQRRLHLWERQLDEFYLAGIRPIFVDPSHGHEMHDIVQRIHRQCFPFEVLGSDEQLGLGHDERMVFVGSFHVRGTTRYELQIKPFHMRLVE